MFNTLIAQAVTIRQKTTTYNVGVLQSKAYRILKKKTSEVLLQYSITPLDWALLGTLSETLAGLTLTELALRLGVESPLVTRQVIALEKAGLLLRTADQSDLRVKHAVLTARGRTMVAEIEPVLKQALRSLLGSASKRDLLGYFRVLSAIVGSRNREWS